MVIITEQDKESIKDLIQQYSQVHSDLIQIEKELSVLNERRNLINKRMLALQSDETEIIKRIKTDSKIDRIDIFELLKLIST